MSTATSAKSPAKGGKDIAAFRQAFDKSVIIPRAIEAGLKTLGPSWEPEGEFIRRCGVAGIDFSKFRDQYAEFYVVVRSAGRSPQRVWCGDKAYAEKLREYANGNG